MNSAFFIMLTLINKKLYAHILYDSECLFYKMITSHFAKNYNLQCIKIKPCTITEFNEPSNSVVDEVTVIQININSHQKSRTYFYIVFKLVFYNLILGLSWMKQNKIILNADRVFFMIEFTETIIQNREASVESKFNHVMMSATFFTNFVQKKEEKWKKIDRCLKWQSTASYNTNATLWDVVQAYTDCLNDSNKYIKLSAHTKSRSV